MFGKKRFIQNNHYNHNDNDIANNNFEKDSTVISTCSICNAPVKSIYTAIRHKETGELVHFDCVIRELVKEYKHKLGKNLRIYYIGAGDFAIVREIYDRRGYLKSFEVIERIEYEKKEK
ncbi:MAG: hypothetical protein ACP5QT_05335 [Brevinematia bacterium]